MRGLILILALLLPLTAGAQVDAWIGIFDNPQADLICRADIQPGAPVSVYILVAIAEWEFPDGITAAEFRVENLPGSGYEHGGIITATWSSDVVVGDLDWDFSIAWPSPQLGNVVLIGQLDFLMLDPAWIGVDHVMSIEEGNVCECMVLVDHEFVAWDLYDSGIFTWNPTDPWFALCMPYIAAQENSWGEVKSLY